MVTLFELIMLGVSVWILGTAYQRFPLVRIICTLLLVFFSTLAVPLLCLGFAVTYFLEGAIFSSIFLLIVGAFLALMFLAVLEPTKRKLKEAMDDLRRIK